jgi:polyisoprenoid-binding protein YceI
MKYLALLAVLILSGSHMMAQSDASVKLYNDKKNSTVTYAMNHPMHAWTGESHEVTSIILTNEQRTKILNVAVSVKVATFDSQNANRDSHVIETTEAIKYPAITFSSKSIEENNQKLTVTGILNFHGVNQAITFEADKKMIHDKIEITGGFEVKMTSFLIDPPSLMGLPTDDLIKIQFKMVY